MNDTTHRIVAKIATMGAVPLLFDPGKAEIFCAGPGNNVSVISDRTNRVVATIPVGTDPYASAYDPHLGEVMVANYVSNNVTFIDDTTNRVVATVAVGSEPNGIAYDTANGELYVSNGGGTISIISTGSHSTSTPLVLTAPGVPRTLASTGGSIPLARGDDTGH